MGVFLYSPSMEKESVIISEGERPIWQIIIASIFFTISIFFISNIFISGIKSEAGLANSIRSIFLSIITFLMGLKYSTKSIMFFDLKNKKYKNQYSVGPIKVGKWKELLLLEYVSVFKNGKGIFEINLWYKGNNHFNIYNYFDQEEAFEMGYYIANQLNIKLLDATEKGNFEYLDMFKLKEKYDKPESSN